MYIAGLNVPLSPAQGLEVLVILINADFYRYISSAFKANASVAEAKGGRIRPESMPTFMSRMITHVHGAATLLPPAIYIVALALNGLAQPGWMARYALPDEVMGISIDATWKNALRVMACVAGLALRNLMNSVFRHLGDQWHAIGRREKPRVVQTGPYKWVRHPLYSAVLLHEALWCLQSWSYAPLVPLGITAAAFAIKMPIEEAAIQRDDGIREQYRDYMKKVPSRLIPYIW